MTRISTSAAVCAVALIAALAAGAGGAGATATVAAGNQAGAAAAARVKVDPQEAALRKLRAVSGGPTNVAFRNGFPHVVHTSVEVVGDTPVARAKTFLKTHRALYAQYMSNPFGRVPTDRNRSAVASPAERERDFYLMLQSWRGKPTSTADLALAVRGTGTPNDEVVAFSQFYKGVEVYGANLLVLLDGTRVLGTVGALLSDLAIDVHPRLTSAEAEAAARAALASRKTPALARTDLVIFEPSLLPTLDFARPQPHLAWRVALGGGDPTIALVDAVSGELLYSYSQVKEDTDGYVLDLEDANGTNAKDTDCFWWTDEDDEIGDEDGVYPEAQGDPDAVAAWNFAKQTYLFYHDAFGRHSYDNDDGEYELYVHASNDGGASWQAGSGDCDLVQFNTGFVGFDVLVHEIGHATLDYSLLGGPDGKNEPGALNESYSDMMAAVADGNWTNAEATTGGGGPTRSMSNPPAFATNLADVGVVSHPDRMSEFVVTSDDDGGEHVNNGIPNKAAFLLADGGTHPDNPGIAVSGLGRPALGWLAYNAGQLTSPASGFLAMRGLMLIFAQSGFGANGVCQVRNAWAAVEVGDPDLDCDGIEESSDGDGDGALIGVDNCPFHKNPSQLDTDGDGKGNVCDGDADEDGVTEPPDNCPGVANSDQKDENLNGIGKPCDPTEDDDFDDDGDLNADDNCLLDHNPGQQDVDNDGDGDACDPDSDGDGWSNDDDNAPFEPNPDQADADKDGIGDVSDDCPTTADDAVAWTSGIPELGIDPQPLQPDSDDDGKPDACDDDVRVGRKLVGRKNALRTDGLSRQVDAKGDPDRYLKVPLSVMVGARAPEWYGQHDRRALVLDGIDRNVKVWVTDDTGRTVARPSPKVGDRRLLRFRPLAGRRYLLFLYFNTTYPTDRLETFTATMTAEPARHQDWPEPPPIR